MLQMRKQGPRETPIAGRLQVWVAVEVPSQACCRTWAPTFIVAANVKVNWWEIS